MAAPDHLDARLRELRPHATALDELLQRLDLAAAFGLREEIPFGPYRIVGRLGSGGMAVAFMARDPRLQRDVAIKIQRHAALDPEDAERFRREGLALAALEHPHILRVHEAGDWRGVPYVAVQLARGGTIETWLQTPRTLAEIVGKFIEAGEGLAAAHRCGLVHRDVKPSNLFLDADGRVLVGDFGLVALSNDERAEPSAAEPEIGLWSRSAARGSLVGTPAYMAPEQRQGARVDHRSDQYALCLSLADALFGRRAPGIEGPALGWRTTTGERVPRALMRALSRGLRQDPTQRYADMVELLGDLRLAIEPRWRRRGLLVAAGLGSIVVGVSAGIWASRSLAPAEPAIEYPFRLCVEQRLTGVHLESSLTADGHVQTGFVPYLDPALPVRADDRGYDDDFAWRARARHYELRDLEDQRLISAGFLDAERGCVSFTWSKPSFVGVVVASPRTSVRDGALELRAGQAWESLAATVETTAEFDTQRGTTLVRLPETDATTALTLATYAPAALLPSLEFPRVDGRAQRVLLDVGSSACGSSSCTSYAAGVSTIHLAPGDERRKYVGAALFGRAVVEQRLGRAWTLAPGSTSERSLFALQDSNAAARAGWESFFAAVVWNRAEDRSAYATDHFDGCVPWPSQLEILGACPPASVAVIPSGYAERWQQNYLPLTELDPLAPQLRTAPDDPRETGLDWALLFWSLHAGSDGVALEQLVEAAIAGAELGQRSRARLAEALARRLPAGERGTWHAAAVSFAVARP